MEWPSASTWARVLPSQTKRISILTFMAGRTSRIPGMKWPAKWQLMARHRSTLITFHATLIHINSFPCVHIWELASLFLSRLWGPRPWENSELQEYENLVLWLVSKETDMPKSADLMARKPLGTRVGKKRKDYLSFGSRPSLVYCQQMSPMRSCTLALAIVTTVIGSSLSWLECRGR